MITLIDQIDELAQYECDCGCEFWVNPNTEENLIYTDDEELVPQCPECFEVME